MNRKDEFEESTEEFVGALLVGIFCMAIIVGLLRLFIGIIQMVIGG